MSNESPPAANAGRAKFSLSGAVQSWLGQARSATVGIRVPTVATPWQWADEGGLYLGEDGAWLYQLLPSGVLAENNRGLDDLLHDLHGIAGERKIHLVTYSWEELGTPPDGLPAALTGFIGDSLRGLRPASTLLIGAQLVADPKLEKPHTTTLGVVRDTVDRALLEYVPDRGVYNTDRAAIAEVLAVYGGAPASGTSLNMLEHWYALGVASDVQMSERDEAISLGENTIELAAVRSLDGSSAMSVPLVAPEGGALVVSARGKLKAGAAGRVVLNETSIVVGQRSSRTNSLSLSDSLQACGAEIRKLPLRQVPALLETLPTSCEAVSPFVSGLDAQDLMTVGFRDDQLGGHRLGVYVGMVSPGFVFPRYCDPFATPGETIAVAGGEGSGKSFTAAMIAAQCNLLGLTTIGFYDGDGAVAEALTNPPEDLDYNVPEAHIVSDARGLLDPFTVLPPRMAAEALVEFARVSLQLTAADVELLTDAWNTVLRSSSGGAAERARLLPEKASAVWARVTQLPAWSMIVAPAAPMLTGGQVWDLESMLSPFEATARPWVRDLLGASAVFRARGGIVIDDNNLTWGAGSFTERLWKALVAEQTAVARVVTTGDFSRLNTDLWGAVLTIALSSEQPDDHEQLAKAILRRVRWTEELAEWFSDAGPAIDADIVVAPAAALVWGRDEPVRSMSIGPVPEAWVDTLTCGDADSYFADLVYES